MSDMVSSSGDVETVDDIEPADFTITSIVDPAEHDENENDEQGEDSAATANPTAATATATATANGTGVTFRTGIMTRAKSTSSFVISPKRKSSIIVAETGQRIQRSYSTWNNLSASPQSTLINNGTEPTSEEELSQTLSTISIYLQDLKMYILSLCTKPILKASISYFLASLVVYSPTISDMLGSSDSKHLTCTVCVYFHPSRSVGSMLQALMFVSFSLFFGIGISIFTFMLISLYLDDDTGDQQLHLWRYVTLESPAVITMTLLICCTSLGLISFWKHRVCKQTFNTACSLAAILIISSVIKVYSRLLDSNGDTISIPWEKIASIISCVICGCLISVLVCFTIWRKWAQKDLIKFIGEVKFMTGDILATLCDLFIMDEGTLDEIQIDREKVASIFKDLKSKMSKLDGLLEETMFECLLFGREKEFWLYKDIVNSEKRLVADLGGLRRALEFKWEMIEYYDSIKKNDRNGKSCHHEDPETAICDLESHSESNHDNTDNSSNDDNSNVEVDTNLVQNPEELIELFLYHLAPSTKSFVFTMKEILDDKLYDNDDNIEIIVRQYLKSLTLAKELFESHQKIAIDSLYKQDIFQKRYGVREKINQEEVAATCANFSFSITQVSTELETFLIIMNALLDYNEFPTYSFNFLKFWKKDKPTLQDNERNQIFAIDLENVEKETIGYKIWKILNFARGVDFQFGFRVGLGALILASFAFLDSTRHIFNEWRGEWVLVTYCIIMNKSLGGTAMTIKWRFLGTFMGAVFAYCIWEMFFPNVAMMAIFGFLVSIPCFNIVLNWKANNAFGRFILLTYNLTILYSYTMSLDSIPIGDDDDDWEGGANPIIWEIAFHRYVGVSLGVVWALVITMTLFPVTARGRIKRGISVLWLRMGVIWKRGALSKKRDEYGQDRLEGLRGLGECHLILNELRTLLKQAPMEVRLKGPFPIAQYTKLMDGSEGILDAFENINSIVDVDPVLSPVESVVLDNLKDEMYELQNRVFLVFYMLASALKLGMPLASDPASTDNAMDKLLSKLADIRKTVESRKEIGMTTGLENIGFVLFYSYCLVTNSIVNELSRMMQEVVEMYGKLDEETLEL